MSVCLFEDHIESEALTCATFEHVGLLMTANNCSCRPLLRPFVGPQEVSM